MECFFNPKSIAVIGASPNQLRGGNAIVKNLVNGYQGSIYPVNPKHKIIENLRCFASISEIKNQVDMAIIFIPALMVPETLRDCAAAGVKGVIIESGGFAEIGEDGKALQEECRIIQRETGIRIWGPNCMGVVDARRNHVFSFLAPSLWEGGLTPGSISVIVQSGMLSGSFIVDLVSQGSIGISKVCSIGNKLDIDECELLEFLIKDPETSVIALYLEGIPDGRRFLEIVSYSPKPIVVLKGGRSPQGAKGAMSHTASLAGDDRIMRNAFIQGGVIQASDFHQMFDLAHALALVPNGVKQGRIAVVTFSGSAGIVTADFFHRHDIHLADLSPESCRLLKEFFPPWMTVSNPLDLWPAAEVMGGEAYERAVQIVLNDPGVDALLIETFVGGFRLDLNLDIMAALSREQEKPIFFWVVGMQKPILNFRRQAHALNMPVYREISRAAEAIHTIYTNGILRRKEGFEKFPVTPISGNEEMIRETLRCMKLEPGSLNEYASKRIFKAVGIPTVSEEIVRNMKHVVAVAKKIGYPIVLKGLISGKIHKTDLGLVKLNLRNEKETVSAFKDLCDVVGNHGQILLQKYIQVDYELICGMIQDAQYGPCVMLGLGGVMAEVFDDVVFRVAPFGRRTAEDMMDSIRSRKLLHGFRGKQTVNRESLANTLMTLGWIGLSAPEISQIDINPLAIVDGQILVLDATVILTKGSNI
jgi:acetyltransferase